MLGDELWHLFGRRCGRDFEKVVLGFLLKR